MRIDKFLKVSRILKRRTVSKEACESRKILLNGKPAKPSSEVKAGDVIEVMYAQGTFKARVLSTENAVKKEDALSMYEVIS